MPEGIRTGAVFYRKITPVRKVVTPEPLEPGYTSFPPPVQISEVVIREKPEPVGLFDGFDGNGLGRI